ncbi:sensor histidine kinase [Ferrimonas senticii]|uniref:sensor histidine kinase n=1 Tax=Ferrimonas senticii TaxID=394566 RepID=UPI0004103777|nr:HAMP domain-containing sensor histidine kinase [Ferrimonas senticii]
MRAFIDSLWHYTERLLPLQKLLLCRSIWLLLFWGYFASEGAMGTPYQFLASSVSILLLASLFHVTSMLLLYRQKRPSVFAQALQISAELIIMTALLAVNGGATNAFVSALILPVVFAGVSLSTRYIVAFTTAAMIAYSWLIWQMPKMMVMHEMDMTEHYHGMWVSFLLSVVVIALVVGTMAKMIAKRERAIALQREAQLRQEQLLALGTASAQVTHNVATPLATMQMLYEELAEMHPTDPAVADLAEPLAQCRQHLDYFRQLAVEIREGQIRWQHCKPLLTQLQEAVLLHFPDQKLRCDNGTDGEVKADGMLLPALLNLVQNAVAANHRTGNNQLQLSVTTDSDRLVLSLRDFGDGIAHDRLQELGGELLASTEGLGIAVLLSNTTLERLGGSLKLSNHPQQGAIATVTLPYRASVGA